MTGPRTQAKQAVAGSVFIADLPKPLQILMDEGIRTFGAINAVRLLQRAAGLPMDGILTRNQAVAISGREPPDMVSKLLTEWALYRMGSRYFDEKGRGWLASMFKIAQDVGVLHDR